jgi:hypothetical protein
MTDFIVGGIVGLVVGWNFLPQPVWVASLFSKLKFW